MPMEMHQHAEERGEAIDDQHPRERGARHGVRRRTRRAMAASMAKIGDVAEDRAALTLHQRIQHHQQRARDRENDLGQEAQVFTRDEGMKSVGTAGLHGKRGGDLHAEGNVLLAVFQNMRGRAGDRRQEALGTDSQPEHHHDQRGHASHSRASRSGMTVRACCHRTPLIQPQHVACREDDADGGEYGPRKFACAAPCRIRNSPTKLFRVGRPMPGESGNQKHGREPRGRWATPPKSAMAIDFRRSHQEAHQQEKTPVVMP